MKTQTIISNEAITLVLLIVTFMTIASCSGKLESSDKEELQTTVSQKNTNPPSIDIQTAALMGDLEAIRQHIKSGSDLNEKEPLGGSSALITAAAFGKTDVAIALIKAGADLNINNNEGSTALHTAAFFCRTEIVEALLADGANKTL